MRFRMACLAVVASVALAALSPFAASAVTGSVDRPQRPGTDALILASPLPSALVAERVGSDILAEAGGIERRLELHHISWLAVLFVVAAVAATCRRLTLARAASGRRAGSVAAPSGRSPPPLPALLTI
jgi:hypothetical protein